MRFKLISRREKPKILKKVFAKNPLCYKLDYVFARTRKQLANVRVQSLEKLVTIRNEFSGPTLKHGEKAMNLKKLFGGLLAAAVFAGMTVMAQEAEKSEWMPEFDFNMKYASRYLSKGKVVNPKKMLFFDASLSLQGFYGGIWIADDWNDYYRESGIVGEPEEIDYYFGYGYTFEELPVIDSLSLDLCVSYYDYPKRTGWQCKGEQQWEYALSLNAGVFLNPGIKLCWDSENEIWYGNFNAGWDYNFKDEGIEALTFNTGL